MVFLSRVLNIVSKTLLCELIYFYFAFCTCNIYKGHVIWTYQIPQLAFHILFVFVISQKHPPYMNRVMFAHTLLCLASNQIFIV